jgi:hypothetical protein
LFDLRIGETVTIAGHSLTVAFDQVVEDSRCPVNTTCFWAGHAVVRLGLRLAGKERGTLDLQTVSDPFKEGVFHGYCLRLIRLSPAPVDSSGVPPSQYVATVTVRKRE